MGIPMSLLGNLGLSGVQSQWTDKIFDRFFKKDIKTFEDFHLAFLDACSKINPSMLGANFRAPTLEKIKDFYNTDWKEQKDVEKRKEKLVEFIKDYGSVNEPDSVVVTIGIMAPPAAMILKKSGPNVPAINKFKLHLIPDCIFVSSITCLAIIGTKVFRMNSISSTPNS